MVQLKGFKTYSQTGLTIHPADRLDVDATLQVGQMVERVEVIAQADLIKTDSGAKVDVITSSEVRNISTVGRNAMELLFLLPGTVNSGFDPSNGSSFLSNNLANVNVNGLRNDQNDVRLDNAHILCPGNNQGFDIEPNMDMIAEFSIKTSNFEADQGRSPMIIDAVSKSGGRDFHGVAYWYHRNAFLNANDFSNNVAGIPKPNSRFNYPGFNIGGPVLFPGSDFNKNRDKLFFFVGVEWQRQLPDPGTQLATVPTAAQRAGDFSELLNTQFCDTDVNDNVIGGRYLKQPCQLLDPSTGTPFQGNVIPDALMTDNGKKFLNLFPFPNFVDSNGVYNFAGRPLRPRNRSAQWYRVDYNISESTRLFVRLNLEREKTIYDYGLWAGSNSGWTSNIPEPTPILQPYRGDSIAANVVTIINPTLTNEIMFSYQDNIADNHYEDPAKMSKAAIGLDFQGLFANNVDTVPQITDQWSFYGGNPGAGRWGGGNVGAGVFGHAHEWEIIDNLTKVQGAHTLKFGVTIDRVPNDQNFAKPVEGLLATDESWGLTTGNQFGDILTEHYKGFQQASADLAGRFRFWTIEGYANDSWKVNRRLTLNFGLRMSWLQPWQVLDDRAVTFDPSAYDPSQPSNTLNGILYASRGEISKGVFDTPGPAWQPRVGFALDVFGSGKSVVRGGFGLFVQRDQGNTFFNVLASPPNEYISTPQSDSLSLADIEAIDPFGQLGNISTQAWNPRDTNVPQVYEWSLTWSQSIGFQTVLEASYVGNVSRHLFAQHDINAAPLGSMWAPGTTTLTDTNTQAFRQYAPWGAIFWSDHSQTANYNSLQMTARRRVSNDLSFLAAYTWSKTLGYAAAFNVFLDPFDSHLNYGLLPYDRAHTFSISYVYQLPRPGEKYFRDNRVAKGVLDGWQLSGITRYVSGAPLAIRGPSISCINAPGESNATSLALCNDLVQWTGDGRTWYGSQDRGVQPVLLSNPGDATSFSQLNDAWLNSAAVSIPGIGELGTYTQPTFRGPGFNNWDLTLFKRFPIREKRELEFRWAAFNVFNRAQYDSPVTSPVFNWNLPLGATSLSQGTPELVNTDSFGRIFNKHGHRQMELVIKFYF